MDRRIEQQVRIDNQLKQNQGFGNRSSRSITLTTILKNHQKIEKIIYLCSRMQANGRVSREIRRRIILEREVVSRFIQIWKDHYIPKNSKLRLLSTLTFLVMLYVSETWILKAENVRYIKAFEMWAYR